MHSSILLIGINFSFWLVAGVFRYFYDKVFKKDELKEGVPIIPISIKEIAALLPAHNEELSICSAIKALLKVLPKENIYVVNDCSTDKTSGIARSFGVNVNDISPNIGKARALVKTIKDFNLITRYKAVLINDADVEVDPSYFRRAVKLLEDQNVACVAGHQETKMRKYNWLENYFIYYRVRLWKLIQYGMRFGQTWELLNALYIVPGAISMYKTKVLSKIEIDAPGLIIEDFNMTFEVHKKNLGRIAYSPGVKGFHQDPYTFSDYVKQVERWHLGFWQTVKRNGIWPSLFWLFTGEFIIELFFYCLFLIFLPVLGAVALYDIIIGTEPLIRVSFISIFAGIFILDYILTIIVTIIEKKPLMLLYGLGFFFLHIVDALIYLYTIPLAFSSNSHGIWQSPKRKLSETFA